MLTSVDCLIVGAGFSGLTIAERLTTQQGKTCLIVEKRDHPPASTSACRQRQVFWKASEKASRREAMAVRPPQGPRSYTLAAWGPSTLIHSAVKFGAIALYFCTSFCAGAIALYFCTSFCASL